MNDLLPDPPRWRDVTTQANLAERAAGDTVRALGEPAPLTGAQLGRIAARIRSTRTRPRRHLLAVVAALLLGIATAASAAHLQLLPSWLGGAKDRPPARAPHASPSVAPARKPRAAPPAAKGLDPAPNAKAADGLGEVPASTGAATPASTPVPSRAAHSVKVGPTRDQPAPPAAAALPAIPTDSAPAVTAPPVRRLAWLPPPAPARSAVPTTVPAVPKTGDVAPAPRGGGEAPKHLSRAIRLLRSERDPKAALALLDAHADELLRQGMGHEALIVRVEALLALERKREALRLLDGAPLSDAAASRALLVTRGKLRAADNRCADAVGDFTLALAEAHPADRQALGGRALCRQQLGDRDGARADLDRYRREFPADERLPELERRLHVEP